MTPSSYPHEVLTEENNAPTPSNDEEQPEITVQPWQLVGECPENTIPIKRITKEDLLREDNIKNHGNKSNISQPHQFYHPKDITNYSVHEVCVYTCIQIINTYSHIKTLNLLNYMFFFCSMRSHLLMVVLSAERKHR